MNRLAMAWLAGGAMLAPVLAPAQASDEAVRHNVQCFIATSQIAGSTDPQTRAAGAMSVHFFAGQIFGQAPGIDLTAALRRELPLLDKPRLTALIGECSTEMKRRGDQIVAAGQALRTAPPKKP